MPQVEFAQDYNWKIPGTRSRIAYKAGWSGMVKRTCATEALAAGVLVVDIDSSDPCNGSADSGNADDHTSE